MSKAQLVSRVQQRGQITIPVEIRQEWGLEEGDVVTFEKTDLGVYLIPQRLVALRALDRIGQALKDRGITLEEMIEDGRAIRGEIVKEKYGIADDSEDYNRQGK